MKKWSNPEVWMLGVENTKTFEVDPINQLDEDTGLNKGHVCHNPYSDPCTGGNNDHSASGNKDHVFTGKICPTHGPANNGNEACCCYTS